MFPSDRLTRAGASPDELVQLEAEHEASTPEAQASVVKRLERIAEQDIREWLDDLRSALHFGAKPVEPAAAEGPAGPTESTTVKESPTETVETRAKPASKGKSAD